MKELYLGYKTSYLQLDLGSQRSVTKVSLCMRHGGFQLLFGFFQCLMLSQKPIIKEELKRMYHCAYNISKRANNVGTLYSKT